MEGFHSDTEARNYSCAISVLVRRLNGFVDLLMEVVSTHKTNERDKLHVKIVDEHERPRECEGSGRGGE